MKFLAKLICCIFSFSFLGVFAELHAPEVQTKLGSLKGEYVSVKGNEIGAHAFLGVPFAKPPLGPLRLAAPQPVERWEGLRDATKQPNMCIQNMQFFDELVDLLGGTLADLPGTSEDCLYLNIYTPANRAHSAKLPVMVWIHGGGFTLGSASVFDGSALAAYQDVVVVLVQYRLGLLGFLSTGDEHVSGNFGLLDQLQALRWVKEHIHNFGGDPDLVTIFGESAGGVSVSLLLLSPLADGLFHHAIAESGTAAMDVLFMNDVVPVMQMVANTSGCSHESTEKFGDCMRNLDIDTIEEFGKDLTLRFPIIIDGHFLTKPINELFHKKKILTLPFMTGVNNHEGGFVLAKFFAPPNWTEGMDREHIINTLFAFYPDSADAYSRDLIVNEYARDGKDRVKNRDAYTELLGDSFFTIPAIKTANAHRDAGAAVYLYEYQHPPLFLQKRRPSFVKSDHADEIFSVLGYCFTTTHVKLSDACTEEEEELSRIMMSYWGNFARTGSPNGDGLVHWPKYGAEEEYLAIDLKKQVPSHHLKKNRFVFVTQTMPEKRKQHEKTLEVQTKLGSLKGEYVSVKGKETGAHAFLGVPFAKPPLGPLRLAAPQPVEKWEGLRDATKQPNMCIQYMELVKELFGKLGGIAANVPGISEDCLYLNIYTPANRAPDAKLPVMMWIHGGGLTLGAASMYDGSALAAYQDVVVVLVQYRLGFLGFFSTEDDQISGNFGFLDQIQALKWIQEHIHNFGGDPDSVTIFGESAGGVSVSLLLLSPLSDGLFHRAIAESGTAALETLLLNDPAPVRQMVANVSGCSLENPEKISDCLRNLDIDTIEGFGKEILLQFPLNINGHFLKKPMNELYRTHELLTVPFMTGINNHEGGYLLGDAFAPPNWTEGMDQEAILNMVSMFYSDPKDALIRDLIVNKYIGTGTDRVKNRDAFTELLGDLLFFIPAIKTINAHRDAGAAVYLYEYQHPPIFLQKKRPSFVRSDHGDEIFTVFGFCFTTTHIKLVHACTEEEEELSRIMMSYWGNFARTGSPNGDGLVHWPKYGAEEEYLAIDLKKQATGHHLKKDQFIFVTQTLPEKRKQHEENMDRIEL
ncbi:cocaine esterase [Nematolebias whitei]|uniref:cocaine esterase n=1 Tax=Nematolebias whitei TaxID=451745 RepID=UPI0018978CDE|nr:cocaine esterase [Nematolebias whitei]